MLKKYSLAAGFSLAIASIAALAPMSGAHAADMAPFPVKAPPIADVPFFIVNDNRLTYAYQFTATDPGVTAKTAKQVYAYTHFDVWAYGTNFFTMSLAKSDHADPALPCPTGGLTGCAGAAEFYGIIRSTFGFNEIFNTKAFGIGPLHNVSFVIGADGETENIALAPNKKVIVAGLQFAFDLPYKGFFNVNPMLSKEWNHNSFTTGPLNPSGNTDFNPTWAVETNYYMDLGFLPPNLQVFSISGRANWYGPKGNGLPFATAVTTKTEFNSEPIRLTLDASKAVWGSKYAHFVDVWVAYRYWQNKFGLDHNANGNCIGAGTGSCTEKSLYSGITVKF